MQSLKGFSEYLKLQIEVVFYYLKVKFILFAILFMQVNDISYRISIIFKNLSFS